MKVHGEEEGGGDPRGCRQACVQFQARRSRALVEGLSAAVPSTREETGRCTAVLAETGLSAAAPSEEEDERLYTAAA